MIEPKIDEFFEYEGHILKCVEDNTCDDCFINNCLYQSNRPICSSFDRNDKKSVKFIKMERPEIKAGMLVEIRDEIRDEIYLVIPTKSDRLVGITENSNWHSSIMSNPDIVKIGWPRGYSANLKWQFDEVLWEKPKETILTMQEIADKFGIPVEQLKIKK